MTWLDQARDAHRRDDIAAETAMFDTAIRADRGNAVEGLDTNGKADRI